jgi:hypothetical protein
MYEISTPRESRTSDYEAWNASLCRLTEPERLSGGIVIIILPFPHLFKFTSHHGYIATGECQEDTRVQI